MTNNYSGAPPANGSYRTLIFNDSGQAFTPLTTPEPGTYAMFACGGLIVLGLR